MYFYIGLHYQYGPKRWSFHGNKIQLTKYLDKFKLEEGKKSAPAKTKQQDAFFHQLALSLPPYLVIKQI